MKIEVSNRRKTTLYTRVLLNPPIESNCTENPGGHVNGWRILCDDIVIIATASENAVKNGRKMSTKIEKRRMFPEDLDCDLSTAYSNLPLRVY